MTQSPPILYIKTGCPWCVEVIDFMQRHAIAFELRNVTSNPDHMAEMVRKSGQTKAPTLDWHGEILADFGVDELRPFLRSRGILP